MNDFQALRDAHEADTKELEAENAKLKSQVADIADIIGHFFPDAYIFLISSSMFCA